MDWYKEWKAENVMWHWNRHLINECKGNSSNEEEKWHDEVSQVNSIPGGMSNDGEDGTSVIHHYHKLKFKKGKPCSIPRTKIRPLLINLFKSKEREWKNWIQKQRGRGRRQGRRFGWVCRPGVELAPNRWAATVVDQPLNCRRSNSILVKLLRIVSTKQNQTKQSKRCDFGLGVVSVLTCFSLRIQTQCKKRGKSVRN